MADAAVADDRFLDLCLRIAHAGSDQKTVHLGLRQRVGADLLDRVLGGNDKERKERIGHSFNGYTPLFHRLQHCTLGLGHGAVDFVHQQQIIENGPPEEGEFPLFPVKDGKTGNIGGQEVAGALQPAECHAEHTRQGKGKGGFAESGNILEQDMSAGQQGCQRKPERLCLAGEMT